MLANPEMVCSPDSTAKATQAINTAANLLLFLDIEKRVKRH